MTKDTPRIDDSVKVFWNPKQGVYLVQTQALYGRYASADFGTPVEVAADSFLDRGPELLVGALDSFRSNRWSPDVSPKYTTQEYRRFRKEHFAVSVKRLSSGDFIVSPLHHEGGGYVGLEGEDILIPKGSLRDVMRAILEAFEKAT